MFSETPCRCSIYRFIMAGEEQRIPMRIGDISVLDSEFNSIKDRYSQSIRSIHYISPSVRLRNEITNDPVAVLHETFRACLSFVYSELMDK